MMGVNDSVVFGGSGPARIGVVKCSQRVVEG